MNLAEVSYEEHGDVVVATMRGELDMSNAGDLLGALTDAVDNEAAGLVLEFSAVEYLDSSGIQLIYRLREALRRRGQWLRLVIPPESAVEDTLRLAGIERDGTVAVTLDAALSGDTAA